MESILRVDIILQRNSDITKISLIIKFGFL